MNPKPCESVMNVIVELSLFPIGKGVSVGEYVARALSVIEASGLPHQLGPMGTCIEGDYDAVMAVVRDCYQVLAADCERVYMTLKVDARADRTGGMTQKVRDVRDMLDS